MLTPYINGKFVCQALTGVQRVVRPMVLAMDEAPDCRGKRFVPLTPHGAPCPPLKYIEQRHVGPKYLPLNASQQWDLPRAACDGLLRNLAGASTWHGLK